MRNESPEPLVPDGGATAPSPAERKRIKQMEVMVADVIVKTPDTTTFVLFTGNDRLGFLEAALSALEEAGVPSDRIRRESYG